MFQSTHSLRSATDGHPVPGIRRIVSIHALLAECDVETVRAEDLKGQFQSTHSLRSATTRHGFVSGNVSVSIHALLAECDLCPVRTSPSRQRFNPRTPCGVRPVKGGKDASGKKFQSTHSLRSATVKNSRRLLFADGFNPRTPCGVRPGLSCGPRPYPGFNPRTPCGVRQRMSYLYTSTKSFQSTHSLRSATVGQLL